MSDNVTAYVDGGRVPVELKPYKQFVPRYTLKRLPRRLANALVALQERWHVGHYIEGVVLEFDEPPPAGTSVSVIYESTFAKGADDTIRITGSIDIAKLDEAIAECNERIAKDFAAEFRQAQEQARQEARRKRQR